MDSNNPRTPDEISQAFDKLDQLEDWAPRAAQALQDVADEAQAASDNPDGRDQCRDLRALIDELDAILANDWLTAGPDIHAAGLDAL